MFEDKAKELGRLIGQSAEYKAVKRSNDALNPDKDAVTLLRQMRQLRLYTPQMMERGWQPRACVKDNLDALPRHVPGQTEYQTGRTSAAD